jgi:hypothetical protein
VLGGHFRGLSPERHIDKHRLLNPLTGLILSALVDRKTDIRDCCLALGEFQIYLSREITHESNLIETSHLEPLLSPGVYSR